MCPDDWHGKKKGGGGNESRLFSGNYAFHENIYPLDRKSFADYVVLKACVFLYSSFYTEYVGYKKELFQNSRNCNRRFTLSIRDTSALS